jgi:protein-tyrosine-phosphatase
MAEGICRAFGTDVECASAGSRPASAVAANAVAAMGELGIDVARARPKGFADLAGRNFDFLVTMGCAVVCPVLPGATMVRWEIPDPYGQDLAEYRRVRDIILAAVTEMLRQLRRLRES